MNTILERIQKKQIPIEQNRKINFLIGISDKYLEEVHTQGLSSTLIEEGTKLVNNVYNILINNTKTKMLFDSLPDSTLSATFLTCVYSLVIVKNIDWAGTKTINTVGIGAILHDIGLVRFSWFAEKPEFSAKDLSEYEYEEYLLHPEYGHEMLAKIDFIPEGVRQIVLQHHEYIDGTGFPNKLLGKQIYPLAKIVALASYFSDRIVNEKKRPLDILREFIPNAKETEKFDPSYIKALIQGFIKHDR